MWPLPSEEFRWNKINWRKRSVIILSSSSLIWSYDEYVMRALWQKSNPDRQNRIYDVSKCFKMFCNIHVLCVVTLLPASNIHSPCSFLSSDRAAPHFHCTVFFYFILFSCICFQFGYINLFAIFAPQSYVMGDGNDVKANWS